MQDLIIKTIQNAIPGSEVHVDTPDGTHYTAVVVSASFEGKPLIAQHRVVMNALKQEFDSDRVHALQLQTMTPEQWAQRPTS